MTAAMRLLAIRQIINDLDELPDDHEPTPEELWEAIRRIEKLSGPMQKDPRR